MLFSEAVGRKVVSAATAETVGKIDEFVVDPCTRTILALVLKRADEGEILRWSAITAFGADAVIVTGADVVTECDERIAALSGKDHRLLSKRVLTVDGDEIGSVEDVEFDADTGQVTGLHMKEQHVEGGRLRGVGSYAVVVDAAHD